jgi:hypothetical protein
LKVQRHHFLTWFWQVTILEKRLQEQELNGTLAEGTSARLQLNEFKASVQNGLKTGLLELEQRYEAST